LKLDVFSANSSKLKWLKIILVMVIVFGVFIRFVNIDRKTYWTDEVFTSFRSSGFTELEVVQSLRAIDTVSSEDLQKYQYSDSVKNYVDVVTSLAAEEPQHAPLYFLLSKPWVQAFGKTITSSRSISVLASLLTLAATYWLSIELFGTSLSGLISVALIAVSPFHFIYAQEARQYSLWTATTLASCASLLYAMRVKTLTSWIIYAALTCISLYTFLFSVFCVVSHGIYVLVIEKFKPSKTFISYLISTMVSLLLFTPWIFLFVNKASHVNEITGGLKKLSGLNYYLILVKEWIVNVSRLFVDLTSDSGSSSNISLLTIFLLLVVCAVWILVLYSLYFLWKNTSEKVWLFIFSLIVINSLSLIIPDLISGENRSMVSRYFIPTHLSIQLSVAYLFSVLLSDVATQESFKSWSSVSKLIVTITIAVLGILSCLIIAHSDIFRTKGYGKYNQLVSQVINQTSKPLILFKGNPSEIISLSYTLNKKARIIVEPRCYTCFESDVIKSDKIYRLSETFDSYSDVFLFADNSLSPYLETTYKVVEVPLTDKISSNSVSTYLWRLQKK
jgi:uncharacterized membrane protein